MVPATECSKYSKLAPLFTGFGCRDRNAVAFGDTGRDLDFIPGEMVEQKRRNERNQGRQKYGCLPVNVRKFEVPVQVGFAPYDEA